MPIDIENLNPSTRFPYPLPKKKEKELKELKEWVSVRRLSVEKIREIDSKTTENRSEMAQPRKPNGKLDRRAPLQRVEYSEVTDRDLRNELMWDEMIDEIHIHDKKGILIPSTKGMKIKLMGGSAEFAMYIADCIEILTESEEGQKKELGKNSMSSQLE